MGFQFVDQKLVVSFALKAGGCDDAQRQTALPGDFEAGSAGPVADYNSDFGVELTTIDIVRNGFEIGAAAGNQDSEAHLQRYSTRGFPRRRRITSPISQGFSPERRSARKAASTFAAGTTKIIPAPRLKVRRQSSSGMFPRLRSRVNSSGTVQDEVSMAAARSLGSARGRLSVMPPPVI